MSQAVSSSSDLFEALGALRSDPALADVLTPGRNGVSVSKADGERERSQSRERTAAASSPTTARYFAANLNQGSPAESGALEFLRKRAAERESLGTPHWLSRHREEVATSEQRRLENRLRAEQLFATAQLAIETINADMVAPADGPDERAAAPTTATRTSSVSPPRRTAEGVYSAQRSADVSESAAGWGRAASPSPTAASARADDYEDHARRRSPTASLERAVDTVRAAAAQHGAAHTMHSSDAEGMDEKANYIAKSRALGLETPLGDPTAPGNPVFAAAATSSGRGPSPSQLPGIDGRVAAGIDEHQSGRRRRADAETLDVLRKAVADRDEAITRLERRLNEQQAAFDDAMMQARREHEVALRHADTRASMLETQVRELSNTISTINTEAARDAQTALTEAHATFTQQSDALRSEMDGLLKGYQVALDTRLHEVIEQSDATGRGLRDTYTVETAEVITKEKQQLLVRLAREQDLMLREAEADLTEAVERQLLSQLRQDVRRYVNEAADDVLVPQLKAVIGSDIEGYFGKSVRAMVDATLANGLKELRGEIAKDLSAGREELNTLSATLAAETMASTSQLVESAEIEKHRQQFEELRREAERRAEEQHRMNELNTAKTREMQARIDELEDKLSAETALAQRLAEELVTIRRVKGQNVLA